MSASGTIYIYRGGRKLELEKSPDQMVIRDLPENLDDSARIPAICIPVRGVPLNGHRKLRVSDHAGADQAKLNHWALYLHLIS